jgi:hypothetical protein
VLAIVLHQLKVKKVITIFLFIVYTCSALGVTVNYHYCDTYLTKISILNFGGWAGCNCNPKDMPMSCCKDKLHYQKASNHDLTQSVNIPDFSSFSSVYYSLSDNRDAFPYVRANEFAISSTYNRRSSSQPVYLLHKVLRI